MTAYASSIAIAMAALCAIVGCPQLKEDDFGLPLSGIGASAGTGASAGAAGVGGSGGCSIGAAGCTDAGQASAGTGAGGSADGGSTSTPQGDGGSEPQPTVVECSADEVTAPNGICYFVDEVTRTWDAARASCQARGAGWDLVTINDLIRNAYILSITGFEAWIGATDAVTEGTWSWVDEGTPFFDVDGTIIGRFTNWSDGEPNDYDDSDCLRMLTTGQWADWPCASPLGHVCRRTP